MEESKIPTDSSFDGHFEEEDVSRSRERVFWTRSWIRRREERGAYHQLIREIAVENAPAFARYFRMDKEKFVDKKKCCR